jgi:hypothetical protein
MHHSYILWRKGKALQLRKMAASLQYALHPALEAHKQAGSKAGLSKLILQVRIWKLQLATMGRAAPGATKPAVKRHEELTPLPT